MWTCGLQSSMWTNRVPEGGAPTPKSPVSRRICRKSRQMRPGIPGGTAQKPGDTAQKPGDTAQISGGTAQISGRYRSDFGRHRSDFGRHRSDFGRHRSDSINQIGHPAPPYDPRMSLACPPVMDHGRTPLERSNSTHRAGPSELLPVLRAPPTGI